MAKYISGSAKKGTTTYYFVKDAVTGKLDTDCTRCSLYEQRHLLFKDLPVQDADGKGNPHTGRPLLFTYPVPKKNGFLFGLHLSLHKECGQTVPGSHLFQADEDLA